MSASHMIIDSRPCGLSFSGNLFQDTGKVLTFKECVKTMRKLANYSIL